MPQYAYRQMASTCDPLLRGSRHCMKVHTALSGVLDDHTARILQANRVQLLGGMMVSLDLSKAFDKLRFSEMYESLRETGMPEELSRLLLHIHASTALRIVHNGHHGQARMQRGLRQGCGVAPTIYACWTIRFCRLLNQSLREGWVQEHSSIFADDKHYYWEIRKDTDMEVAVQQLRTIISIIRQLGMTINFQKSVAVLSLRGQRAQQVMNRHTTWWNGSKCLRLRMEDHDVFIPIQAQMQYLGAVLSYHNFESKTAELRAQQASLNFAQLRKVLRTSGGLSLARRLSIYKMCVWTALLYGIVSVGVTTSACKTLQSTAAMHLRKLLRIHTKGHTNAAILAQADLPLLPHLQQRADQQARTLAKDIHRSSTLRWQEEERNQQIRQQLDILRERDLSPTLVPVPATEAQQLECSICGQTFVNAAGLHQHIHRQHPEVEQAASMDFRRDKHSMFGLPQCRFCHTRMSSWQTLTKHITQGFCLRVKLAIGQGHTIDQLMSTIEEEERSNPPSRPLGDSEQIDSVVIPADIRRIVRETPVRDLPTHRQVLRANDRQCWLCGQRVVQASRIKSHWQSTHPETWRLCHRHAQTAASSLSSIFRRPW